jgi:hypothetical protein
VSGGHDRPGMRGQSIGMLLSLPVRLHGIAVGRPVDALLESDELRVVGLDVLCGDDAHRFLPLPAATIEADQIVVRSSLVLLEEDELDFYRSRTFSFGALRGRPVQRNARELGVLRDLQLNADSMVSAVVVERDGRADVVAYDDSIRFNPSSRSAA